MSRRASSQSIVASPVLVGAVTVLVAIVAVFLAYNANAGLPFVPTYDLKAELPSGSKLVRGNEVRVGGFRVGVIDEITVKTVDTKAAGPRAVAVVSMKLDKTIEPISADSVLIVRPRSALGLKYIDLQPGTGEKKLAAGATVTDIDRLNAEQLNGPIDLEDVFSTFDFDTRENARQNLTGFGDALSGRGASLNTSIEALVPFATYLTPVMKNLSDPDTELDEFFASIGRASAQVAPVAATQAQFFTNAADTFEAFSACPECLQQTIEKGPATLDTAISSFAVQRPFLADFTELSRRLRPAARTLRTELPVVNAALKEGQPVLRRSVDFNNRTEKVFGSLRTLVKNPNTKLGIDGLQGLLRSGRPLVEFISPYQTVCNYWNLFLNPLSTHLSYGTTGGTYQRVLNMTGGETQDNRASAAGADRPADFPAQIDIRDAEDVSGEALQRQYGPPYMPAIDGQGNADCQSGQTGNLNGPLSENGRYPAANGPNPKTDPGGYAQWQDTSSGGSHGLTKSDFPGLAGPTFTGVPNLRDVK